MKLRGLLRMLFCLVMLVAKESGATAPELKSFNYEAIAPHPRLLLNRGGEQSLKRAVETAPAFKKINDYIVNSSDEFISQDPVVFKKTGKRLLAVSRVALQRLYYLSYSYRMTGDRTYLDRAEKELLSVCAFESWNPSHFLDVGEMCMGVAIAYDWLHDDLPEKTRQSVRKAIVEKAFKPSYDEEYNGFLGRKNNWNPVCNAGLVFGALAIMEDVPDESIAIVERALTSSLIPLETYAPDGNYPEGPGYWNYGTTFQVMLIAALESALGSDHGLSQAPGFMESADYVQFACGPSDSHFNYYDCESKQTPQPTLFWYADTLNKPSLLFEELELIKAGVYTENAPSDNERVLPNALVFGRNLDLSSIPMPDQKMFIGHGITPVVIVRTDWDAAKGKYLGIKGGSASGDHAHMDQGTFVYDVGNLRWAMDFGLQSYYSLESHGVDLWNMSQDSPRWEVFRYNNLNHNTLSINHQKHNVHGRATIMETYEDDHELGAKIDLTDVLNLHGELESATRKATLVDRSYLKIEDQLQTRHLPVEVRWNMLSPSTAEIIDPQTIRLSQAGKTLLLTVTASVPFKLTIRPSEDPGQYLCAFTHRKYGEYNQPNQGTVMVGFDARVPAENKAIFSITLVEGKTEL